MSIKDIFVTFASKYGPHAKVVAAGVLNVVAPGSGALISMTETALDAAQDIADNLDHQKWETELISRLDQSQSEVDRLAKLVECLQGPLLEVCNKAAVFADDQQELETVVSRAIAKDPSLSSTLHEIQSLKTQFQVFHRDIRQIARHQEEVMPVYDRMNRVADYFDELWQSGIKPRDFVRQVSNHRRVSIQIHDGNVQDVDGVIEQMRRATPNAASVCVLEAAAATREFDYPAAQRALSQAVRLRPHDRELAGVAHQVTVMATRTSKRPAAEPSGKQRRLQPGEVLDGWNLLSRRGAGGWGQVFRATKNGESKAIKVMHPELAADPVFLERFKKEIASLWALPKHPNLIAIDRPEKSFGFCMQHQTWYLVMEYIDGPTLESYLASKGAISELLVHQVFLNLIEGLAQAHDANIVHRDIKPGNMIFRKQDQRLVLVDFGLAVGVEDFGNTSVGGISVKFAAPEQHYGGGATKASDVFSLCAVMHYALNYDHVDRRTPHAFNPLLAPESLREVLSKGIVMTPEKRFKDAGELLEVLRRSPQPKRSIPMEKTEPVNTESVPVVKPASPNRPSRKVPSVGSKNVADADPPVLKPSATSTDRQQRPARNEASKNRKPSQRAEQLKRDVEPPIRRSSKSKGQHPDEARPQRPEGIKPSPPQEGKDAQSTLAPAPATGPKSAKRKPLRRLFGWFAVLLALLWIWHGWQFSTAPLINWWINLYIARLGLVFGVTLLGLTAAYHLRASHLSRWIRIWGWSALIYSLIFGPFFGFGIVEMSGDRNSATSSLKVGDEAAMESRQLPVQLQTSESQRASFNYADLRGAAYVAFVTMVLTFFYSASLLIRRRSKDVQTLFLNWDTANANPDSNRLIWPRLLGGVSIVWGLLNAAAAGLLLASLGLQWMLPGVLWCGLGILLVAGSVEIIRKHQRGVFWIRIWCYLSLAQCLLFSLAIFFMQESEFFWREGAFTLALHLIEGITLPAIWLWWLWRPEIVHQIATWDASPKKTIAAAPAKNEAGQSGN